MPANSELFLERIENSNGYAIIQTHRLHIPTSYNHTIHVIELNELENILTQVETSISDLNDTNSVHALNYETKKNYATN